LPAAQPELISLKPWETPATAKAFPVNAIPIIILSGEESSEMIIQCLEAGADDYLVKPFNPKELEARLRVVLRRIRK